MADQTEIPDEAFAAAMRAIGLLRESDSAQVYRLAIAAAAPLLIAAELDRLIEDRSHFTASGDFRPMVLVTRGRELRATALRGEHRDTDTTPTPPACQWAVRHPDVDLTVHRSPHSVLYTASKVPGGVIVTRMAGQEEWVPETKCLCGDRKPADRHFAGCPDTTPPVREPRVWRSDADPEPEDTPTVKDSMGDVWTNDPRLWVTPETQPMTWRRIAKKYGPLTEVLPSTPGGES